MAENTFLGLQPYTEADAYRFKGRTEESQELFRLIVRNDYTVCYAESGEGKTSLLNAGVFPLLRQNMFFPIAITFTSDDYQRTPDSFDTIIDRCIRDSIAEYNENNKGFNVEYKLCSTDFQGTDSQSEIEQELSKYSWWKLRNYKPQAMGLTFTPVFVFDQFEEVFNLPGSIVWTKKFFNWLEDVSSDSCPDDIIKKVRLIIGDKAAFPSIKEEKDFKAVFSLRKEFIGELDYWGMQKCFIPSLKDNRYCLKALTYEGAKKVMTQQQRFEETKVEQVLRYFVQQYSREPEKTIAENLPVIPALLLSVVCDSWEKDIDFFSGKDVNEIGQSLNIILERFYDEALSFITNELKEDNNQSESILENIETAIFALVDSNGKRVRRKSSELSHLDFDAKYKEILSDKRIIKISKVDGEDYVEIVHDALCPIIAKRKELRQAEEAKNLEEEMLREQAHKMRKRMLFVGLFSLIAIIIVSLVLWQNSRYIITQKSLNILMTQKDSIQRLMSINSNQKDSILKLNSFLASKMNIIERQNDSIGKNLDDMNKLNSSLNEQMILNLQQKDTIETQNNILKSQNDSLRTQIYLNIEQKQIIKDQNLSLLSKNDSLLMQMEIIQLQKDMIGVLSQASVEMRDAYTACLAVRSAVESGSLSRLQIANGTLKRCRLKNYKDLVVYGDDKNSLTKHLVFDEDVIDSLIFTKGNGDKKQFRKKETKESFFKRSGRVFAKTCVAPKSSKVKFVFTATKKQEIAVVTEPEGLISLRIGDNTNHKTYFDSRNEGKGKHSIFALFEISSKKSKKCELEIEVFNHLCKDISFVILSN